MSTRYCRGCWDDAGGDEARYQMVVTVRLQRMHAEFPGQSEGVLIVDFGLRDIRQLAVMFNEHGSGGALAKCLCAPYAQRQHKTNGERR